MTHAKHARVVTPPPIVPKEHISADQKSDLRFKLFGKERYIPLTTTILLSLVASIVSQLI